MAMDENTDGINAFADIKFDDGIKRILDVGGGKFACKVDYLREKNIQLLVWDPYNRSTEHNEIIRKQIIANRVDVATSI